MFATYNIVMIKKELFDSELQELAEFGKAISHPARIAILKFLAESNTCISGNISDHIPLSRTTVSQHLKELKNAGLIIGEIDGLKVNYCLCSDKIRELKEKWESFFKGLDISKFKCDC